MTLREFWKEADGVYDFVNEDGKCIDDMDYSLDTEVLDIRKVDELKCEVMLKTKQKRA